MMLVASAFNFCWRKVKTQLATSINQSLGVPALTGPDRPKAGHQMRNSQVRMTNDEIRKNDEARMTKEPLHVSGAIRNSFVIRHLGGHPADPSLARVNKIQQRPGAIAFELLARRRHRRAQILSAAKQGVIEPP